MKKFIVAFDVDGTLRCNCTETCSRPNERIVELLRTFRSMKNVRVIVWSGGGKEYAERWGEKFGIQPTMCFAKFDAPPVHLAFDDQQEFALGDMNIIVNEKKKGKPHAKSYNRR